MARLSAKKFVIDHKMIDAMKRKNARDAPPFELLETHKPSNKFMTTVVSSKNISIAPIFMS